MQNLEEIWFKYLQVQVDRHVNDLNDKIILWRAVIDSQQRQKVIAESFQWNSIAENTT